MLESNATIKVVNRNLGHVGYTIPNLNNLRRQFAPGQEQQVTMEELRQLSYQPGGKNILKHYLIIENDDAVAELLGTVEPEYNYTEADVRELLEHGTVDQLLDCLDFGPHGVQELVKNLAVSMRLNDIQKRQAILDKTGFNVTKAIEIEEDTEDEEGQSTTQARRSAPLNGASAPKYKVTNIGQQ